MVLLYGGSFQKITTSLVSDIIMPLISALTGNVTLNDLSFNIGDASIKYGAFLTAIIDFLLIAISLFLLVRYINKINRKLAEITEDGLKKLEKKGKFKRKKKAVPEPPKTTKICPYCYKEINIKATRCPECTSVLENN